MKILKSPQKIKKNLQTGASFFENSPGGTSVDLIMFRYLPHGFSASCANLQTVHAATRVGVPKIGQIKISKGVPKTGPRPALWRQPHSGVDFATVLQKKEVHRHRF